MIKMMFRIIDISFIFVKNDLTISKLRNKDNKSKTFIEARLTDAKITATVTVN